MIKIPTVKGDPIMKIIRRYASSENAVNVQNTIRDLLLIELECLFNENLSKGDNESYASKNNIGCESIE